MARIGVDFGASVNPFGAAQGAFSGVLGAGGKADLINAQIEAKNAYTRATLAKADLDVQERGARDDLGRAGGDLARARAQGTSNAPHAGNGAAPVPIDLADAQSRWARASQMLSTGAADSAMGLNKGLGGLGMMFGDPAAVRTNYALTGGNPTDHTILGPNDTIGTQSQIAVGNAREAAKAQGDIAVDRAGIPGKIEIENAKSAGDIKENEAKQRLELQLDPLKNPENVVLQLQKKRDAQGGQLSPDEAATLRIAEDKAGYKRTDLQYEDKGTGQHVVVPGALGGAPNLYPSKAPPPPTAAPAVVPPGGRFDPPAPFAPQVPQAAAPAIVGAPQPAQQPQTMGAGAQPGDPAGTMRFGSAKPTAAPTDSQGRVAKYARAKIDAEATLQNFTEAGQLPSQVDGYIRSVMNSGMTAQQIWDQLPDERSRAFFDAAFLFLTGTLREESGAAIGQTEFAMRYPTLIPSGNATPEEIRRKAALRKSDIDGDFAFLPLHLQQVLDAHAKRAGVLFHDADVPYVQPYRPPAAQSAPHPDDDIVEITPVGP